MSNNAWKRTTPKKRRRCLHTPASQATCWSYPAPPVSPAWADPPTYPRPEHRIRCLHMIESVYSHIGQGQLIPRQPSQRVIPYLSQLSQFQYKLFQEPQRLIRTERLFNNKNDCLEFVSTTRNKSTAPVQVPGHSRVARSTSWVLFCFQPNESVSGGYEALADNYGVVPILTP